MNIHRRTYLRPSAVRYRLRKYVNEAANYNSRGTARDLDFNDILAKELVVGIPAGNVPVATQRVFDEITAYGATTGVAVRFVTFD